MIKKDLLFVIGEWGGGEGLRLETEGGSVWRPNYNEFLKEDLLLCAQQVERAVTQVNLIRLGHC